MRLMRLAVSDVDSALDEARAPLLFSARADAEHRVAEGEAATEATGGRGGNNQRANEGRAVAEVKVAHEAWGATE